MKIRKAELKDLSRIAEIFVFNNRINYFPIFHEEAYSFGEMQVVPMIDQYFKKEEILNRIYVYDDGIIRGFTEINGTEICKLYVDPCLQNNGVGHALITFAIEKFDADHLWALEKKYACHCVLQPPRISVDRNETAGSRNDRISAGIKTMRARRVFCPSCKKLKQEKTVLYFNRLKQVAKRIANIRFTEAKIAEKPVLPYRSYFLPHFSHP
mgnify:CR=1 FL=1